MPAWLLALLVLVLLMLLVLLMRQLLVVSMVLPNARRLWRSSAT